MRIGVTGGIGSGKSFVCQIIERIGYPVYYSDNESKLIVDSNKEIKEQLISLLGDAVYENNQLNRPFLAQQLFSSDEIRTQVNAIIHPVVRAQFDLWASQQQAKCVFNEAAILFETGSYKQFDKTILVTAPIELRIQRTMQRSNFTRAEVERRMEAQWEDERKIALADYVIVNDGQPLLVQVEKMLNNLSVI